MLRLISTFEGKSILSLQTGGAIAIITRPIIDPNKLKIIGFHLQSPTDTGSVVMVSDIREISSKGLIVDRHDTLIDPEDLVRYKQLLATNFQLLDKRVYTQSGIRIGKVSDFIVDDKSYIVMRIYVKQSVVKNFSGTDAVIDRRQITEITDTKIIVQDTTTPIKQKAGLLSGLLGNQAT